MKKIIKLTEQDLHNMIVSAINEATENWSGDINPNAIKGFQKDSITGNRDECIQRVKSLIPQLEKFALAGNDHQVMTIANQIATCAKFINSYPEDMRNLE